MGQTTFSGPVSSQNGFTPGSFTTTERDALTNVQTGTLIFNTTEGVAEVYDGSAWVSAFGPAPSTTYTYSFNGTTQGIRLPNNSILNFQASNNLTFEFYMRASVSQTTYATISDSSTSNTGTYIGIGQNNGGTAGQISFKVAGDATTLVTSTSSLTDDAYHHVACVYQGGPGNGYIFIDGIQQAFTDAWQALANPYLTDGSIGRSSFGGGGGGDNTFTGYLSNFRVTKAALYTSNFTPPTGTLPALPETVLLTLQSPTIVDNSGNNLTLTPLSVDPTVGTI